MNNKWRDFVVGPLIHEGVVEQDGKYTVPIQDLTFDIIKSTYPGKYTKVTDIYDGIEYFDKTDSIYLPVTGGGLLSAASELRFLKWKERLQRNYPEASIILDPSSDRIEISSKEYEEKRKRLSKKIAQDYYEKEGQYQGD